MIFFQKLIDVCSILQTGQLQQVEHLSNVNIIELDALLSNVGLLMLIFNLLFNELYDFRIILELLKYRILENFSCYWLAVDNFDNLFLINFILNKFEFVQI